MLQKIRAWWTKQEKRGQELEERRRQSTEAVREAQFGLLPLGGDDLTEEQDPTRSSDKHEESE
jgi:hypothetical protein